MRNSQQTFRTLVTVCALPVAITAQVAAQPRPQPVPRILTPARAAAGETALPPPRTAAGETALPLRVPPPPALLPAVMPVLPAGATSPVPAGPITIDQAVAIGLQHQPTVSLARQATQSAAGRTQIAASGLFPSVSLGSGYTNTAVSTAGGLTNIVSTSTGSGGFNTSLSARQLVFDFGHTLFSVQAARDLESASRAGEQTARQDTTFNIKQAYFTLLENARLADVDARTVAAQRVHLQEARAFWSAGRSPESDVVKAQTNVAEALLVLANAQNAIATARLNLNIAMGIDPRTPLRLVDVNLPPPGLPDLNALVATAQSNRPEIVQARRVIAANQADLRSSQTSMLPAVVADGSLGLRGNNFPGGSRNRTLGLTLQWDIFDSGLTSGRVRESRANLETTRLQLYQAQQTVTQDVTQAYLNFSNAQQRLITTDAEVANAVESLRLAEGRYRAGVAIFLEVTDAQAALATAQGNRVDAAYGLATALAQLNRAAGR